MKTGFMRFKWSESDHAMTAKAVKFMAERNTFCYAKLPGYNHPEDLISALLAGVGWVDASCQSTARFFHLRAPSSWFNNPGSFVLDCHFSTPSQEFAQEIRDAFGAPLLWRDENGNEVSS